MKKVIAVLAGLLSVCMLIGLSGCGSDSPPAPLTVGWAVGGDATDTYPVVFKTLDGKKWTMIYSDKFTPGLFCRDASAVDDLCAWVVLVVNSGTGAGKVLRTVDGGGTWQDVTPAGYAANVVAIKAVTRKLAWVAGKNGYIAQTTNGGASWNRISVSGQDTTSVYTGIAAINADHVWVSGYIPVQDRPDETKYTALIRTSDGIHWEQLPSIENETCILGITANAPDTVRITMQGTGNLYTSTNGGASWGEPVTLAVLSDMNNVAAWGDNVWAVSDHAQFFYSRNGGANWNQSNLPEGYTGMWVLAITALDANRVWIGGGPEGGPGGVLWSEDGGISWNETIPPILNYDIWRISMVGGVK